MIIGIPGIDYDTFCKYKNDLTIFKDIPSEACLTYAPSVFIQKAENSFLSNIFMIREKKKNIPSAKTIGGTLQLLNKEEKVFTKEDFLLNTSELIDNEFPIEMKEGFVETIEFEPFEEMIALDCEMCITEIGFELTRITLINHEKVLYDSFVLPKNPIIDYMTKYSGITEDHLKDCKVQLEDVQKKFLEIVSSKTILVGHSLENDLKSTKIIHKRIIDTSILYPTGDQQKKRKFSLKNLCGMYLKREIQTGNGHDSHEDARAALDLALLKIKNGPNFGLSNSYENVKLADIIHQHEKHTTFIDDIDMITKFSSLSTNDIPCVNDDEVVQKAVHELKNTKSHFIWMRLKGYENKESYDEIKKLNENLKIIYDAIPEKTMYIIVTGYGSMKEIEKAKQDYGDGSNQMNDCIIKAKNALSFFGLKEKSKQ